MKTFLYTILILLILSFIYSFVDNLAEYHKFIIILGGVLQ